MRKPMLAGNWKMNNTRDDAIHFVLNVDTKLPKKGVDCVVCAPAIILRDLVKRVETLKIGAQNMNENDRGAYTGEISAFMLKDTKVDYVIIGHSERRAYYNETNEKINAKIKKALETELKPIVCVGEDLSEREEGLTNTVLELQVVKALSGVKIDHPSDVIIAYEPVWAIGTGKSATSEEAEAACKFIRDLINRLYGSKVANEMRILYGGSMKPSNVKELVSQPDIDGGLVGGASLDEESFIEMCKACALK